MPPLQVKECPPDVYERLKACAREENRSIAQQTLTIIEDHLNMRYGSSAPWETRSRSALRPSSVRQVDDTDYLTRRRKTFERIDALPPFPFSDGLPSAAEILAQIRQEEAR